MQVRQARGRKLWATLSPLRSETRGERSYFCLHLRNLGCGHRLVQRAWVRGAGVSAESMWQVTRNCKIRVLQGQEESRRITVFALINPRPTDGTANKWCGR